MTFLRHLRRNPGYPLINVVGLSLSMATCMLIFQYAAYELSFDRNFESNIYRLGTRWFENGLERNRSAVCPREAAQILRENVPEIKDAVRISSTSSWFDCTLSHNDNDNLRIFNENHGFWFAEQSFISMFRTEFIAGESSTALVKPYSLVLTESTAHKYFNGKSPVGAMMRLRGSFQTHDYTVTGVVRDFPANSHLDVNILASFNSLPPGPFDTHVYLQFYDESVQSQVLNKLDGLAPKIESSPRTQLKFSLERIEDIHLYSELEDATKPSGSSTSVYSLLGVAILILAIAWINYLNLASSKIVSRAREVGIYKVIGASNADIIARHLSEAITLNVISIVVAFIFYAFCAPIFNAFVGIDISKSFSLMSNLSGEMLIVVVVFFVGMLLSGIVPSWALSRLNPIRVLKGKFVLQSEGISFRKAAMIFQFTCTFSLAVIVIVFHSQFAFMRQQELGISISRSLVVKAPANVDSTYLRNLNAFKNKLRTLSLIENVSTSSEVPGAVAGSGWGGEVRKTPEAESMFFGIHLIDHDYISLYDLKLIAGRNFRPEDFPGVHFGNKIEPVILNRIAITRLGFTKPDDAIGQQIQWNKNVCRIVGIVEDFHHRSVKEPIMPILFTANIGSAITLKFTIESEKDLSHAVALIHEEWKRFFPANAFEYFVLQDHFNAQYADDERIGRLFDLFCGLALVISLLGLFSLSLFSLRLRTKEISIRKILGASMQGLITLLSKEYFLLTMVSIGFSMPLAWLAVGNWLEGFAMHVELRAWYFLAPAAAILLVILITLCWQIVQVEKNCSVEMLREE